MKKLRFDLKDWHLKIKYNKMEFIFGIQNIVNIEFIDKFNRDNSFRYCINIELFNGDFGIISPNIIFRYHENELAEFENNCNELTDLIGTMYKFKIMKENYKDKNINKIVFCDEL